MVEGRINLKEFIGDLLNNRILIVCALSWFAAQLLKTIIYLIMNKQLKLERMVGAGGMPSSHAATVCALVVATVFEYGAGSFQFAVTLILALVVLHDARGVRLETGKQATILNRILESWAYDNKLVLPKLKEFVGHTPTQVLVGGIMGVVIAVLAYI